MTIQKIIILFLIFIINQLAISSYKIQDLLNFDENSYCRDKIWNEMNPDKINLDQKSYLSEYFQKNRKQKTTHIVANNHRGQKRTWNELTSNSNENDLRQDYSKRSKKECVFTFRIITSSNHSSLRSLIPPGYLDNHKSPYSKYFQQKKIRQI